MKQKLTIDRDVYEKGSIVVLQESEEYAPAMFIVKDGQPTRDLLTNEFGKIFEIAEELQQAA
jgi:hypothetical protein